MTSKGEQILQALEFAGLCTHEDGFRVEGDRVYWITAFGSNFHEADGQYVEKNLFELLECDEVIFLLGETIEGETDYDQMGFYYKPTIKKEV